MRTAKLIKRNVGEGGGRTKEKKDSPVIKLSRPGPIRDWNPGGISIRIAQVRAGNFVPPATLAISPGRLLPPCLSHASP